MHLASKSVLLVGPVIFPEHDPDSFVRGRAYPVEIHFFGQDERGEPVPVDIGHRVFEIIMREIPCVKEITTDVNEFFQFTLVVNCGPLFRHSAPEYLARLIAGKMARHYGIKSNLVRIVGAPQ